MRADVAVGAQQQRHLDPAADQQRQRAAAGGLQVVRVRGDDQDAFDLVAELAYVESLFV